jgi:DNA invertase Pin-like site-specific DNA recombinase
MTDPTSRKVTPAHLSRKALLYVRQSTLRQVTHNPESTRRQYALRERALALGWTAEQIVVVDCDLGVSGASTDRKGFQLLVAEVSMGRVGIVLGLEVSRLARNSADWHRLLELSALTDTLILDEDGVYDPTQYNDRLLLGLKGTLSEAELHMLRARMRGGLLAKARRGELRIGLPVGLVYDALGHVTLHPDAQVRDSVRLLFRTFFRTGSASATVKHFTTHDLPFPAPARVGAHSDEIVWGRLNLSRAIRLLHNPRYAGAYVFGRQRSRKQIDGRYRTTSLPREQWLVLRLDAHDGYITWQQYEDIQHKLRASARAYGLENRQGGPRLGPALLQGLVVCGRCGAKMMTRYHNRRGRLVPDYVCQIRTAPLREPLCQSIHGAEADATVGRLVLETMTPIALELTLAVQAELQARLDETDRLRDQQVQRVEHDVELARRRYLEVDPTNRLVASSLEADWNDKLRALHDTRERIERERRAAVDTYDEATKQRVLALATDFPTTWNDPATSVLDRKRMVALLIEDVTLIKHDEHVELGVRFRGGATRTLTVPIPLNAWRGRQTHPNALARAAVLLRAHTDSEVAAALDAEGFVTGAGARFDVPAVRWLRQRWKLKSFREHLLAAGKLTSSQIKQRLGIGRTQLGVWRRAGRLRATRCDDCGTHLYDPIADQPEPIQARARQHDARDRPPPSPSTAATAAPGAV